MREARIYYENKNNKNLDHINITLPDNAGKLIKVMVVETTQHDKVVDSI